MNAPGPSVLILGARSEIGRALARVYAQDGYGVILAARQAERLHADAADLRVRFGRDVEVQEFDAVDTASHAVFLDRLGSLPDTAICLVGLMTPQVEAEADYAAADMMIKSNYSGLVSILGEIANRMEARRSGTIIGVSSVAGDRGRAANYVYGSAKAGLTAFLSGLRSRLAGTGVSVITIKPGYVRTRMTEQLQLPAALTAHPDELALAIRKAHKRGKAVLYYRPVWRLVMLVIRCMPERLFVRLKL